ncbi:MAG: hypothetical protein ACAH17_00585 [Candidatus Paceibacterota bacterium]
MEKTLGANMRVYKNLIIASLLVLLLVTTGMTVYLYQTISLLKKSVQTENKNETAELISRVGKIIVLPEGEVPTIATVSNPEELKEQPFFAKAQVGYKVLLYAVAKKAYLYDPVANRIIEVSSITPETNSTVR